MLIICLLTYLLWWSRLHLFSASQNGPIMFCHVLELVWSVLVHTLTSLCYMNMHLYLTSLSINLLFISWQMPLFVMVIVNLNIYVIPLTEIWNCIWRRFSTCCPWQWSIKKAKLVISYIIIMHVDVAVTLDLCIIYDTGVFQSPVAKLRGLLRR